MKRLAPLFAAVLLMGLLSGQTLYVSTQGNRKWSGKLPAPNPAGTDGPLPDLITARDRLRTSPKSSAKSVVLRGGTYWLPETFVLTPADSNTAYVAYKGEIPVLSGGAPITGWKPGDGHLWIAPAAGHFRQLFVGRSRAQRARTPNEGYLRIHGMSTTPGPLRMRFDPKDLVGKLHHPDAEIVTLLNWSVLRMRVDAVDEASHMAQLTNSRNPSDRVQDARYWIENLPEALDEPGEWYHNEETGLVSYWPRPGEDLIKEKIIAPRLETLIKLEGQPGAGSTVHDISFEGIEFSHADWPLPSGGAVYGQAALLAPSALEGTGVERLVIGRCTFTQLGGYAIALGNGSKDNRIVATKIYDVGGGGIKIGDPVNPGSPSQETSGNTVADNDIHDLGSVYMSAVGVWIGQSSRNTVAHNRIHDLPYTAISVGWTWGTTPTKCHDNIVEFNDLYEIGLRKLSDLGAIYTLGLQPGTIIRNNRIHGVFAFAYGGWGIYTDAGSSKITIENNIVYGTEGGFFHQFNARDNVVRNNIFGLCSETSLACTRPKPDSSLVFEKNILLFAQPDPFSGIWSGWQLTIDHNLYWRTSGGPMLLAGHTLSDWQNLGRGTGSLAADPLFVNPSAGDFGLRPASPAHAIGFQPIDSSSVGPRSSPER